jgi:signal transduction histidine kinase
LGTAWAQLDDQSARSLLRRQGFGWAIQDRFAILSAAAAAGTVALTAVTAVASARSPIVDNAAVFTTLRSVASLGLLVLAFVSLMRGTDRRMAGWLLATGFLFALAGLTDVNSSVPFVIGRIASMAAVLSTMGLCFAYPSGRVDNRVAAALLRATGVAFTLLLGANLLLSDVPPVAGPFVRCNGTQCPANPLNVVAISSGASHALSEALGITVVIALAATAVLLAVRAATATRLQRHSLVPMVVWALVAACGYASFIALRVVNPHAASLAPSVVIAGVIAAIPFALGLGLARGRVFAMAALEHLILQLREHSSLTSLEQTMSGVFEDPKLQLLVWHPSSHSYSDISGRPFDESSIGQERSLTELKRGDERIGAAVHDPLLSDDVLRAAGSVVVLALDNERLEDKLSRSVGALESSRRRVAWAADNERRRIEQDLHDGAQQGLIALRIKLHLLEEVAAADPQSVGPALADAGRRVDDALERIRNLAQGVYPAALRDLGLSYALAPVARELPVEVGLDVDVRRRFEPEVETAVYFCCVEALQNAVKHGGASTRVNLSLSDQADGLHFAVADTGPGFEPERVSSQRGISGMRDRIEAVGGVLTISSSQGHGTTVSGNVPTGAA